MIISTYQRARLQREMDQALTSAARFEASAHEFPWGAVPTTFG